MPSKKIKLKCTEPFIHDQIRSKEAREALALGHRGVGAYFAKASQRSASGLSDEEINLLMPILLGISMGNSEARKEIERYYRDINTLVPYGDEGRELEIGLELDNTKPVTFKVKHVTKEATLPTETNPIGTPEEFEWRYNLPIAIEDYCAYRHAMKHPDVAPDPETKKGNRIYKYFFEDEVKTKRDLVQFDELKDKAISLFQEIKADKAKIKMILSLMRGFIPKSRPGEIILVSSLSDDEKQIALRKIVELQPIKFYDIASDAKLKNKYLLEELVNAELVKKISGVFIIDATGDTLGSSVDEAVYSLFEDMRYATQLSVLKAKMQEKNSVKVLS